MDRYDGLVDKQKAIERQKLELEKRIKNLNKSESEVSQGFVDWGMYNLTKNERQEIIDKATEKGLPEGTVKELRKYHKEWESGSINETMVHAFARMKKVLFSEQKIKKSGPLELIREFVFGGK